MAATPTTFPDPLRPRRSTPAAKLSAPGPDAAALEDMLRPAPRVPDHGKLAPWRFLVIEGDARARLGETVEAAYVADNPDASEEQRAAERGRFLRGPVVVAVVSCAAPHPKIPEWEQVLSAGAACQNLMLAAQGHGFGANWITEWIAYDRRILDALGLAPHEKIAAYVHVGMAESRMSDRPRPDLADIVTRI
jgi:nitroreductase